MLGKATHVDGDRALLGLIDMATWKVKLENAAVEQEISSLICAASDHDVVGEHSGLRERHVVVDPVISTCHCDRLFCRKW